MGWGAAGWWSTLERGLAHCARSPGQPALASAQQADRTTPAAPTALLLAHLLQWYTLILAAVIGYGVIGVEEAAVEVEQPFGTGARRALAS